MLFSLEYVLEFQGSLVAHQTRTISSCTKHLGTPSNSLLVRGSGAPAYQAQDGYLVRSAMVLGRLPVCVRQPADASSEKATTIGLLRLREGKREH